MQAAADKINEAQRAQHEAAMFENYLEVIVSLHKDTSEAFDWPHIAAAPPPQPRNTNEQGATTALNAYKPGFLDRAIGADKKERARLEQAVLAAREQDRAGHALEYARWEWYHRVAQGVLAGDHEAYRTVLEQLDPFEELEELGAAVNVGGKQAWYAEAHTTVRNAEIVPEEELKILASGKLTKKDMPKAKYWALYQDHVCSAALRVGRELFALLPIRVAFVHVAAAGVDSATGHHATVPILSTMFEREPFLKLNFDRIDPSDAVGKLTHRMSFKKTAGFSPIEALVPGNVITG